VLTLIVVSVLVWPLPLHLRTHHMLGAFHDGHVWCFDHIFRMLTFQEPWSTSTSRMGYPGPVDARFIAWVPALVGALLRPLLGPLGAYNAVVLLSPAAAALAAWALARRALGVSAWVAAGAALIYAICPYALGSLANGQIAKISHWVLPLALLAFAELVHGKHRILGGLAVPLTTMVATFTSPSTALFLPFAAGIWGGWAVLDARGERVRRALWVVGALGLTAVSMLPAWSYYGGSSEGGGSSFAPGAHLEVGHVPLSAPPMATPGDTLLGDGRRETNPELSSHVTYLGLPLLLLAAGLSFRRFRGRSLAWALVLTGVVIGLGPRLAEDGSYVLVGGSELALPAALLERLGYPLAKSGMYYRAVVMASLGLCLATAGGLGRLRPPWAWVLAALVAGIAVADGVRSTRELWPRQVEVVPARAAMERMAGSTGEGAVLDYPLAGGTYANQAHLLAAVFHGRPTTAVPKVTAVEDDDRLTRLEFQLLIAEAEGIPEVARSVLSSRGFSHVVFRNVGRQPASSDRLERILGPPIREGQVLIWPLAPGNPGP